MKVFCIGTWKSGTTSIGHALDYLLSGKHKSWGDRHLYLTRDYNRLLEISEQFTSFDDTPWNCKEVIPLLSEKYPNAKFILPIRDSYEWIESIKKWYFDDIQRGLVGRGVGREMRMYEDKNYSIAAEMYRRQMLPEYDPIDMNPISEYKEEWMSWYEMRNSTLITDLGEKVRPIYFSKDNPLSWEPICEFLQLPIPKEPFPTLNQNP
jgi:hypothetical protein